MVLRSLCLALVALPFFVACAAPEEGGEDRNWEPEVKDGSKKGATCAPQTCKSAGKTCGTHDDGCGGQIDCGACVDDACVPKTCKDLGKTCGKHDDTCGGNVDCGACATCTADAKTGNTTPDKAADLGAMTDSPVTTKAFPSLMLGDGEEDWFKMKITDAGFGGNPYITVSAGGSPVDVAVYYLCDTAENFATCPVTGQTADTTVGKGCTGRGTASVRSECTGLNENGLAYIRVKKAAGATQACVGYSLDVKIEEDFW